MAAGEGASPITAEVGDECRPNIFSLCIALAIFSEGAYALQSRPYDCKQVHYKMHR
jgi:hypothetical protein